LASISASLDHARQAEKLGVGLKSMTSERVEVEFEADVLLFSIQVDAGATGGEAIGLSDHQHRRHGSLAQHLIPVGRGYRSGYEEHLAGLILCGRGKMPHYDRPPLKLARGGNPLQTAAKRIGAEYPKDERCIDLRERPPPAKLQTARS
jgi:hypothetical protein